MTAVSPEPLPECIQPRSLHEMTSDQLEELLTRIRASRLRGAEIHAAAMAAAKELHDERTRDTLVKQCDMLEAAMDRVDKAINTMEARINKVRALRLELGLE